MALIQNKAISCEVFMLSDEELIFQLFILAIDFLLDLGMKVFDNMEENIDFCQ